MYIYIHVCIHTYIYMAGARVPGGIRQKKKSYAQSRVNPNVCTSERRWVGRCLT